MTARATRVIWLLTVVALAVAGVAILREVLPTLRVEWCKLFPEKRSTVAVPPSDAGPKEVVVAYLNAVAARDNNAVRALATTSFLERHGGDGIGCYYRRLELTWVGKPHADTSAYATSVFSVPTRYTVDMEEAGPETDGECFYDFSVGRNNPSERWRIIDYGNG